MYSKLYFTFLIFKQAEDKKATPNIVIIVADDLGYNGISTYGNLYIKTPNLDLLASQGVLFTDFHSNRSVCSPTRSALLTGKYQQRTSIEAVITAKNHRDIGLKQDEITIAEEFKKHNYTCGMYGKWHLGYDKTYNPTLQGVDEFKDFVSGNVDYHAHFDAVDYLDWWNGSKTKNEAGYTSDLIIKYDVEFTKTHSTKPFLLYLPHEAPHEPYQRRIANALRAIGTPGTTRVPGHSIKGLYKEIVEVMGQGIGKIMDALKIGTTNKQTVFTMDLPPALLDFIREQPSEKHIDGISTKDHLINQTDLPKRDVFLRVSQSKLY
ncbi:Sulfatase [Algibacter lectus]|uniref:sulfatase-like hydrolase/transferase n=1 Tax=Algibacter lectus TaxID=221126 RepID=UPI0008E4687C|nr:sulfatase-like hydrolase/transferase [Algibacter lectus]SFB88613.1 Sulfatase [Algibacter lectus]